MKVELLRSARINHPAGDIIEVSPAVANFLFSVGSAKPTEEKKEEKKATKKSTK